MFRHVIRRSVPLIRKIPVPPVDPIVNCRVRKLTTETNKIMFSEEFYKMKYQVTELEKKIADIDTNVNILKRVNPDKEMTKIARTLVWGSAFTFCFYTFFHTAEAPKTEFSVELNPPK